MVLFRGTGKNLFNFFKTNFPKTIAYFYNMYYNYKKSVLPHLSGEKKGIFVIY